MTASASALGRSRPTWKAARPTRWGPAGSIFSGSKDTLFRIHGTNQPEYIGEAISSGCIRMTNEDVIDLYKRVKMAARWSCSIRIALRELNRKPIGSTAAAPSSRRRLLLPISFRPPASARAHPVQGAVERAAEPIEQLVDFRRRDDQRRQIETESPARNPHHQALLLANRTARGPTPAFGSK